MIYYSIPFTNWYLSQFDEIISWLTTEYGYDKTCWYITKSFELVMEQHVYTWFILKWS